MPSVGRPGAPGYGVRIDGATRNIVLDTNVIRETRLGDQATQKVGIYIGPQADYITAAKNILEGNLKSPIVDESHGGHNQLAYLSGR